MSPVIIYTVVLLLGFALGAAFFILLGKRSQGDREDPAIAAAERAALDERYSDQLRERDQIIAHAKAEANQFASELAAVRQEAEARVAALNDDLLSAIEQRSKLSGVEDKIADLELANQQKEAQLSRLMAELSETKISLAAIDRTHQIEMAAKQSECDRVIREKEESVKRERELLSTHVQAQLEDQKRMFNQTEKALLDKLGTVSDQSLKSATEQFLALANETFAKASEQAQTEATIKPESIEDLLGPVRESLERLERQNQLMDRRRDSAFDAIEKGIQQITSEAAQLANVLRKPAAQGAWGETTIITILENAGLIAGENFILKESGESASRRTDVIIKLPQDRMLVIDSKAPLEAFWDGANAPTEEARAIRMKAHARMVREHVKELGSTYYWSNYDALPDCVIMFLPTEGAYFAALEADPSILQEAKEAGVYLANPMTVLNMAHIAAYVLADERVRQNAQEIKNLGSELYERLRMFGEHFSTVGQNLRQSVDSYNKALTWIDRNVMPTARKMQLLGTAKTKTLQPPTHIDKSVKSFQGADLRELPVESTFDDASDDE